jgi:large repetitive protein
MRIRRFSFVRFAIVLLLTFVFSFTGGGGLPWLFSQKANAHSVAQVQTAKYFAPETVQMLKNRITAGGTPGLQAGDVVSYIIQFNPVANGATVGAGGYVTDYIPANTEVVDASMVQPDGLGGFVSISPGLPGPISNGYGTKNQQTFSNWSVTNSFCTAAGKTAANCTGSLAQIYADTGIFYSTDLRTKVNYLPSTSGRVGQGTNGYIVKPTGESQLNGYLNQTQATTHNRWDADQTNAFGTTSLPIGNPISSQAMIIPSQGRGATPFNAGSAVAGPDTGYQLDNTGTVGPWQRISYPGSRIGNPTGPAISATVTILVLVVVYLLVTLCLLIPTQCAGH